MKILSYNGTPIFWNESIYSCVNCNYKHKGSFPIRQNEFGYKWLCHKCGCTEVKHKIIKLLKKVKNEP